MRFRQNLSRSGNYEARFECQKVPVRTFSMKAVQDGFFQQSRPCARTFFHMRVNKCCQSCPVTSNGATEPREVRTIIPTPPSRLTMESKLQRSVFIVMLRGPSPLSTVHLSAINHHVGAVTGRHIPAALPHCPSPPISCECGPCSRWLKRSSGATVGSISR